MIIGNISFIKNWPLQNFIAERVPGDCLLQAVKVLFKACFK